MRRGDVVPAHNIDEIPRFLVTFRPRHHEPRTHQQGPKELPDGDVEAERRLLQHGVAAVMAYADCIQCSRFDRPSCWSITPLGCPWSRRCRLCSEMLRCEADRTRIGIGGRHLCPARAIRDIDYWELGS